MLRIFAPLLIVLGAVFFLVWACTPSRSDECQAIYDQQGSTIGGYMEEGGYC
jgi:hypothetical protein